MSAIFGILRFDGAAANPRDLERMGNVLAHRGPDGRKFMADGAVGLGHCLMRVNTEDLFEAQPLHDRDSGVTLVADCRIDNREELASAFGLSAADIRDMPDSAFILRAYKTWGEDAASHLLGDFAFALWDGRAKKLVLGRDHMGQRCVHYHKGKTFFAFATEIKALWALEGVPREWSEVQIGKHLLLDRAEPDGASLFEGIWGIRGGDTARVGSDGSFGLTHYWEPHADRAHEGRNEAHYIANYRRILEEAVACRLRRTIKPAALCFSGGFDSSAIAGLAGPVLGAQGRKLVAVASVMPEGYRGPSHDARPMVDLCKRDMPHLDVRYYTRDGWTPLTGLADVARASDEMVRPLKGLALAMFRIAAQSGARLVMDGHGGDYTVNPRGHGALGYFLRSGRYRRFLAEFGPHLKLSGRSLWRIVKGDILGSLFPWRGFPAVVRRGFAPAWADCAVPPAFTRMLLSSGAVKKRDLGGTPRDPTRMRDQSASLLRRTAAMPAPGTSELAGSVGLDLTRPFHDKRVVEFALAIPEALYVKGGRNRYLACMALADLYPPEFQVRSRRQDDRAPDLPAVVRKLEPDLLIEVERLSGNPHLARYVDFGVLKRRLQAREPWGARKLFALRALLAAGHIAHFNGDNGEPQ